MSDEGIVRDVNRGWVSAVNAGDVEECVSRLAEDVTFMPPNDLGIVGRPGFESWGKELFCQARFHMLLETEHVLVSGDLACLWGEARVSVSGEVRGIVDHIKWVHAFRREPDGSWKMILNIWNSNTLFPVN